METLLKRKTTLQRKIDECSDFVRGSITSVCSTCNRATCICSGKPKAKAYRLTYKNSEQKSKIVYVSKTDLPKVRKLLANYVKRRKLTEQLFELNIEIFKKQLKHER